MIFLVQDLVFEPKAAVFQLPMFVVKVLVNHPCKDHFFSRAFQFFTIGEEINPKFYFHIAQHIFNDDIVTTDWNSLVTVIKVVIIKSQTNRKTLNDERRQVCCRTSPLLLRIALDQLFIDIWTNQLDSLFFQVLRLNIFHISRLFRNLVLDFLRSLGSPHSVEGIHVEGKIVEATLVVCHR